MTDKSAHVLILDDNEIDLVVNERLIALNNFDAGVETFSNCDALIASLQDNNFFPSCTKVIFLIDIQMPDMDGFDCIQKMLASCAEQEPGRFLFFMLSSSIDRQDVQRALDNPNIERILQKPLDVQLLKSLVG